MADLVSPGLEVLDPRNLVAFTEASVTSFFSSVQRDVIGLILNSSIYLIPITRR